jgi:hypothetical protein
MPIDFDLKRSFSAVRSKANLPDRAENYVGNKFLFAYEIDGRPGIICGRIEGLEYSETMGMHLFVSCPSLDVSKLKSLYWNPETSRWTAIVETDGYDLLRYHAEGKPPANAPNCIPGGLEIIV